MAVGVPAVGGGGRVPLHGRVHAPVGGRLRALQVPARGGRLQVGGAAQGESYL